MIYISKCDEWLYFYCDLEHAPINQINHGFVIFGRPFILHDRIIYRIAQR